MSKYILALDQGTTSSRAILFSKSGSIIGTSQKELRQIYPKPGWVEHDPLEIWTTQISVAQEVIKKCNISSTDIAAIGIANQRETVIVWDKNSGRPLYNAIVWQCRRTAPICENIKQERLADFFYNRTGLIVDAYFSATKIKWILDNIEGARVKAENGDLLFGNVDAWLIWNLTGGIVHVTDFSNASRTMLYNISTLNWDEEILALFNVPEQMLPSVKPSSYVSGYTAKSLFGSEIPIAGSAGDQQAALFGQACFTPGMTKVTYGTGSFMLMNTGDKIVHSSNGLLSTIAWGIENTVDYALEGSIFTTGAAIQWLRDELGLISNAAETEYIAASVPDTNGVYFVPAFVGLGAPYWDMYARGGILGLNRSVNKNHIVRAALESIAYQIKDVLEVMQEDSRISLKNLRVDGGASVNSFLLQFQADILGVPVHRPKITEITALGAALMAGLAIRFWKSKEEIIGMWDIDKTFVPVFTDEMRFLKHRNWKKAINRVLKWEDEDS